MKKIIMVCLFSAMMLMGCDKEKTKTEVENNVENILEGQNSDSFTEKLLNSRGLDYFSPKCEFGETDKGFYYVDEAGKLYFFDKNTYTQTILCSDIDCKHMTEIDDNGKIISDGCPAVFYVNYGCRIYKDKLYVMHRTSKQTDEIVVSICDLDGSNRKVLIEDITKDQNSTGRSIQWYIKDDEIYVFLSENKEYITLDFYVDIYDVDTGNLKKSAIHREFDGIHGMVEWSDIKDEHTIQMGFSWSQCEGQVGYYKQISKEFELNLESSTMLEKDIEYPKERTVANVGFGMLCGTEKWIPYIITEDGSIIEIDMTEEEKSATMSYAILGDEYICLCPYLLNENGKYYTKFFDTKGNLIEVLEHIGDERMLGGTYDPIMWTFSTDTYYTFDINEIGTGNIEIKEFVEQ